MIINLSTLTEKCFVWFYLFNDCIRPYRRHRSKMREIFPKVLCVQLFAILECAMLRGYLN